MKYSVETASYDMIYVPSFVKIRSGFRKSLGKINIQTHARAHTHTHTEQGDLKPNFYFFKIRKVGENINILYYISLY
jgi:hypothetical protein